MDPKLSACLDARFQSLIVGLFDAEQYRSALFWAERYFCHDRDNHPARHLYALSLLHNGQNQSALNHVNQQRCHECTDIYAKCCVELGRFGQAKDALESIARGEGTTTKAKAFLKSSIPIPERASILCRAGSAAWKGRHPESAIANFTEALKLCPHLWEAFEGLCALGSFPPIDDIMSLNELNKEAGLEDPTIFQSAIPRAVQGTSGVGFFTPEPLQPANNARRLGQKSQNLQFPSDAILGTEPSFFGGGTENSMIAQQGQTTRTNGLLSAAMGLTRNLTSADESGPAPKKARNAAPTPHKVSLNDNGKQAVRGGLPQKPLPKQARGESSTSARRSTRLLNGTGGGGKEQSKLQKYAARARKGLPRSRTRSRSHASEDEDMASVDSALSPSASPMLSPLSDGSPGPSNATVQQSKGVNEWQSADLYIFQLLRQHASAYQKMAQYECREAIKEVESFSPAMQRSPWALALVGRAYYELVEYAKAEGAFKEVRRLDPYRLWDMELYSTLLWHLQRHVRLSFLAQELVAIDPKAPQAWIAVGNCFSLQKERSKALTCFLRASQMDPSCAYAYTLSGHESIDEDLEQAMRYFQTALRVDPRHYNAWYGLGTCYLRLSKLRQAEYHFRRATELHPTNAVLLGCLGLAVEKRGLKEEAFNLYKEAVRISPDNALVRYRRAKILISLQRYQAALEDLEHLRDIAPDESNVVYQLAMLYRHMGKSVQSALQLATARDLSPQSMSKIKKLVETTREEDELMEE